MLRKSKLLALLSAFALLTAFIIQANIASANTVSNYTFTGYNLAASSQWVERSDGTQPKKPLTVQTMTSTYSTNFVTSPKDLYIDTYDASIHYSAVYINTAGDLHPASGQTAGLICQKMSYPADPNGQTHLVYFADARFLISGVSGIYAAWITPDEVNAPVSVPNLRICG